MRITATKDNYLDVLDSLSAMETLELAETIFTAYDNSYTKFDSYVLEKPWKFPEVYVPALNGELDHTTLHTYLEAADDEEEE